MGRLTQRIRNHVILNDDGTSYTEALEKLAEYEDLEEQGHLIKLPCKVGDEVCLNSKISSNSQIEKIEDVKVMFLAKTYFFGPDDVLKGRIKICKKIIRGK